MRPVVKLVDEKGNDVNIVGTDIPTQYFLPGNMIINLEDNAEVKVVIPCTYSARRFENSRHHRYLPRVADLFEARRPKEPATC